MEKVGGVATINAIKVPENTDASWTDLIFDGWYTSPTFESNTMKTWGDTLSDSVTALYAKWNCPDGSPYNSNNQCALWILVRFMDGETEYTRSIVLSWEEVSAPATNPEKSGYNFLWWFESWANSPFVFTGTPITWDLDLYAHWDINKYDVNVSVVTGDEDKGYLSGMWSTWISLTWLYNYGTELVFIAVPKFGYVFDYWMNGDQVLSWTDLWDWKNQLTVIVDQVLDIIAFFKETPTPYTVEHYQQNLSQTWYDFVWSGIMYWIANEQTNATGTNYTWFTLSWNLADYQTWINADWSTVVRLYYNRVSVVSYLVSFNADRWTFVSWSISQSVASWTLVTPLTEEQKPVFPWYRVDGWYKTNPRLDSNAEEWIFDQDVVTGDITLYAHWTNNYDVRDLDIYFVVDDSTGSYYTTLDRDVWASQLWVAWYQYQWWNNHWFKACTTSKCNSFPGWETTSTNQVDVSDYDPNHNLNDVVYVFYRKIEGIDTDYKVIKRSSLPYYIDEPFADSDLKDIKKYKVTYKVIGQFPDGRTLDSSVDNANVFEDDYELVEKDKEKGGFPVYAIAIIVVLGLAAIVGSAFLAYKFLAKKSVVETIAVGVSENPKVVSYPAQDFQRVAPSSPRGRKRRIQNKSVITVESGAN